MLQGFDNNGNLRGVKVTEDGKLLVDAGSSTGDTNVIVQNDSTSPIPVSGNVNVNNPETTLAANVATIGTTATSISVGKKVTEISIANYSETANITVGVDTTNYVVAPTIAVDLPINKEVTTVTLTSTEADTQVQYVIKGED